MENKKIYLILGIFSFIFFVFVGSIYANNDNYFLELKRALIKIEESQNINSFFSGLNFIVNGNKVESIRIIGEKMELKDSNAMTIYFSLENIKNKQKMVLVVELNSLNNNKISVEINNKRTPLSKLSSKNRERVRSLYKKIMDELVKKIKIRNENINNDVDKFFS